MSLEKVTTMRFLVKAMITIIGLTVIAYGVSFDQTQPSSPAMQAMTVAELEKAGDACRADKDYAQAIKYFDEALRKDGKNAKLYNKRGLAELSSGLYGEARTDFAKATKYDHNYPQAWNDLGVVSFVDKKYSAAVKYFQKAIALDETKANFHVNLGITYFSQNNMDAAMKEYTRALQLDPEALLRSTNSGLSAQIASREERARQDFMLAKIYAKLGNADSCFICLEKAKEDGYTDLGRVYKDEEFAQLRQDARMASIVPPPTVK